MITETDLPGVFISTPFVHQDTRGSLAETYRHALLEEVLGRPVAWEQENVTVSRERTIRGLHYSLDPRGQAKYVTCVHGLVWDVVVDVRQNSPTFGIYGAFTLSGDRRNSVYIPAGYAHGFLSMTDSVVAYKISTPYSPEHEQGINPLDEYLDVRWLGVIDPVISAKDRSAPSLRELRRRGTLPLYATTTRETE